MKILAIAGMIILLVGLVLLITGLSAYENYPIIKKSPYPSLPVPFDYSFLIEGSVISIIGITAFIVGLKKRI